MIYDGYAAAYDHVEGMATKHGLQTQAKTHYSNIVGDDVIGSTCKKVGCDAKDITAKLTQVKASVADAHAQAYEYGAKAKDTLDGLAGTVVDQIETHVPSHK